MDDRQFGPYRLVRQIAVGGMAEIHLAKTKGIAGFEKYVAVKMIHPNFAEDEAFIQMLVDEAKIAVQLNHGNIAQTFDLGRVGDTYYITMEFVDGADLYKLLRRASEIETEMPLDVCAFVAKEVASALDHAHRKRDHTGRSLGIVHRDVSPQNVLISYAGEVKLVDFGIAKATMKVRQTAAGVIKGKYYYMSPEQAWGEPLDFRSDIFSAGIVLYEMMTGQMLYLEEDLHKLLDMARRANIAPPTSLRKGIPPQLEKIVMRALAKLPDRRYQSAADFATDLERFLHSYSPVFTATKLATVIRQVLGDPQAPPDEYPGIEIHEGSNATFTLSPEDLIHDKEELHDENSVIFRVSELKKEAANAGRVTRQSEPGDLPPQQARRAPTPAAGSLQPRPAAKPRQPDEDTRQVESAPPGPNEESVSGLLPVEPPKPKKWDAADTDPGDPGELDNIGEHTMVSAPPGSGYMMDVATEDGVDATVVSAAPEPPEDDEAMTGVRQHQPDEDGPTISRDFTVPKKPSRKGAPPPALSANIQPPAVSELRKPRASRKTPAGGNVLQAMIGNQPSAPMPTPRPPRSEDSNATTLPQQPSPVAGLALGSQQQAQQPAQQLPLAPPPQQAYNGQPMPYGSDASGLPLGVPTPPQGQPIQMMPGVPPHLQPYQQQYGYPPPQPQQPYPYPPQPQYPGYQPAPVTPGGLYQLHPYGAPPPQPMSLTGQMRLFEADEIPSQYKVGGSGGRWLKLVIAGLIAISVAAGVTFFIIRSTRDTAPAQGSIHVDSVPQGAEVLYDGTRLAGTTPMTIDAVPVGTRHTLELQLARHKPFTQPVDIPKTGGEVPITAMLKPITGKLRIATKPDGADIYVDGQLRGRTSTTINDIDMAAAVKLELRLKDYRPYVQNLEWPANGEIDLDVKLEH